MRLPLRCAILGLIFLGLALGRAPAAAAADTGQHIQSVLAQTLPGLAADAAKLRFSLTQRHPTLTAGARAERAAADKQLEAAQATGTGRQSVRRRNSASVWDRPPPRRRGSPSPKPP